MLDPLRELSNVKIFHFQVNTSDCSEQVMKLQLKHVKIVSDVKRTIPLSAIIRLSRPIVAGKVTDGNRGVGGDNRK